MANTDYPKFYIKEVGGAFSIEHRLTHCFMTSVDTEEELVKEISRLNKMGDKELWRYLLYTRYVQIPQQGFTTQSFNQSEEWFYGAWKSATDKFYKKHPKLLKVVEEIPYNLVRELRREKYLEDTERNRKADKEREELAKEVELFEKKLKTEVPIGNTKKVEEARIKKKLKIKKRLKKVKTESGLEVPLNFDSPF